MVHTLLVWNAIAWLAWMGYWFVRGKEGGDIFDRSKVPKSGMLLTYSAPFALLLGFGLNERGQKIRRMMGIGSIGMFGIPFFIIALQNLFQ